MSKQQYRSEMGIMGDILDVTADGGRDGILYLQFLEKPTYLTMQY